MKKGRRIVGFLALFIFLITLALGVIYYYVKSWDNKIYPNIYVENIDVSGLSLDEAQDLLISNYNNFSSEKITAVYDNQEYPITFKDMNIQIDVKKTVNKAFKYGKDKNLINKYIELISKKKKEYNLEFTYDQNAVREFVQKVKKAVDRPPKNATIRIENDTPVVVKEEEGRTVDADLLYKDIIDKINKYGIGEKKVVITVKNEEPTIKAEALKDVNYKVSSATTYFSTETKGRADNIALAASKLNGKIIMPGEVFSFNKETGERTLANGFKGAPVIVNSRLVDGVAGGVCQVSTTLYNAVIKLGIKSISRRNHSLAPAYIEPGFDATVSESIDYKFKNTSKYPLYLESIAGKGKITFNIYSNKSLTEIQYKLYTEILEVEEPKIYYNTVDSLPSGAIKKVQAPVKGYKVKVYLIGYKNGKEISRELISKDNYEKVDGIYNIGL
ncbi:MAG: hypothetical protein GX206_05040 [Clostridiales bacterium]|nr:hypothetical protein [Clostridiales bacterium]